MTKRLKQMLSDAEIVQHDCFDPVWREMEARGHARFNEDEQMWELTEAGKRYAKEFMRRIRH